MQKKVAALISVSKGCNLACALFGTGSLVSPRDQVDGAAAQHVASLLSIRNPLTMCYMEKEEEERQKEQHEEEESTAVKITSLSVWMHF